MARRDGRRAARRAGVALGLAVAAVLTPSPAAAAAPARSELVTPPVVLPGDRDITVRVVNDTAVLRPLDAVLVLLPTTVGLTAGDRAPALPAGWRAQRLPGGQGYRLDAASTAAVGATASVTFTLPVAVAAPHMPVERSGPVRVEVSDDAGRTFTGAGDHPVRVAVLGLAEDRLQPDGVRDLTATAGQVVQWHARVRNYARVPVQAVVRLDVPHLYSPSAPVDLDLGPFQSVPVTLSATLPYHPQGHSAWDSIPYSADLALQVTGASAVRELRTRLAVTPPATMVLGGPLTPPRAGWDFTEFAHPCRIEGGAPLVEQWGWLRHTDRWSSGHQGVGWQQGFAASDGRWHTCRYKQANPFWDGGAPVQVEVWVLDVNGALYRPEVRMRPSVLTLPRYAEGDLDVAVTLPQGDDGVSRTAARPGESVPISLSAGNCATVTGSVREQGEYEERELAFSAVAGRPGECASSLGALTRNTFWTVRDCPSGSASGCQVEEGMVVVDGSAPRLAEATALDAGTVRVVLEDETAVRGGCSAWDWQVTAARVERVTAADGSACDPGRDLVGGELLLWLAPGVGAPPLERTVTYRPSLVGAVPVRDGADRTAGEGSVPVRASDS